MNRSEKSEDRRQRKIRLYMALFIVSIMILSTIAGAVLFFSNGSSSTIRYNGYKLKPITDANGNLQGYTTKIEGTERTFYSAPEDSLAIPLPQGMTEHLLQSQAIVLLFDPADNQTQFYDVLRFDMAQAIPDKLQVGAITREDARYDLPVLGCGNSTPEYPFIYFTQGNGSISYENGCYVLAGNQYNYALLRDRIVYAYYGVTKD